MLAVAATLLSQGVFAQSTLSIPNPLARPQSYSATGKGQKGGAPDGASIVPPLPAAIKDVVVSERSGGGSSPRNESIIGEVLSAFTVTAIVGNRASLRNNAGNNQAAAAAPAATQQQMMPPPPFQGNPQRSQQSSTPQAIPAPLRMTSLRVKTDVPVYVGGIEVIPTVLESRVEFRLAGQRHVFATVILESQSSYGYVPMSRDTPDPTVTTRVNPATGQVGGFGNTVTAPAPLGANGQTQAPR